MKILLCAYCFGPETGHAMIGVYKRALKVAMELADRGHQTIVVCPGREAFEDELTRRAEERIRFVGPPFAELPLTDGDEARRLALEALRRIEPDLVVVGEVPLAGLLLEITLCAAELEVPVVCLDNALHDLAVERFCELHGAMFDALVLSGPSTFHLDWPPAFLEQVPPQIDSSPRAARRRVEDLGLSGRRLMTVLAYDDRVGRLGASLYEALADPELAAVFIAPDRSRSADWFARLPPDLRSSVRRIEPLSEREHFGLVEISDLVVGKGAVMQVTECLTLGTPFVGLTVDNNFRLDDLPAVAAQRAHASDTVEAGAATVVRARRFLAGAPAAGSKIHWGGCDGAARTARFLASMPLVPRAGVTAQAGRRGLSAERLRRSLGSLHPGEEIEVVWARLDTLREAAGDERWMVGLCRYRHAGRDRVERLWIHAFDDPGAAWRDLLGRRDDSGDDAAPGGPGRRLLYACPEEKFLIERFVDQTMLPPL